MKAISGVYAICNTKTGEASIGASGDIPYQWIGHRSHLRRGDQRNQRLQATWREHGPTAFALVILQRVDSALPGLCHHRAEARWVERARAAGVGAR